VSGVVDSIINFPNVSSYDTLNITWQTIAGYYKTAIYGISIFYDLSNNPTYIGISGALTSGSYTGTIAIANVSRVVIGSNVTSIGPFAFLSCNALTSVTIGNSVTSIGFSAFESCSDLTSVTIPNSVTSIGVAAFQNCYALTSVTIGNSVTSIGGSAFYYCYALTSVTIGNSVTSIGGSAFESCSDLTSVTIPDSVTSIGDYAFNSCSALTNVVIEDASKITTVNTNSFTDVSGVVGSTIVFNNIADYNSLPSSWQTIANYYEIGIYNPSTFYDLSNNPIYIDISGQLTSNDYEAYISKNQISNVIIGTNVTSIGNYAFYQCSNLTSVTIPDSVTSIGTYAFEECSALTSVTIGNNVTSIGRRAFLNCSALTSVTIPNSVTSIGNYAFYQCYKLTSVTIGNSVTSIGFSAFESCSDLTNVVIKDASIITTLNANSFTDVKQTFGSAIVFNNIADSNSFPSNTWQTIAQYYETAIYSSTTFYDLNNNLVYVNISGELTSNDYTGTILKTNISRVVIGSDVTSIGTDAFLSCSALTSVSIPDSVTSIGNSAFSQCFDLTSVTIPDSVTSIGNSAFEDCSALTSVTIENSVTSIGDLAFFNCADLTSVTIPDSVTSIGSRAFDFCYSLTNVVIKNASIITTVNTNSFTDVSGTAESIIYFPNIINTSQLNSTWQTIANYYENKGYGHSIFYTNSISYNINIYGDLNSQYTCLLNRTDLKKAIIGYDVLSIKNYAFENCVNLTFVTIPDSVIGINRYAFENCSDLTSVTIPNSVTTIGDNAFKNTGLTSVTIPNSVKRILSYAFYNDNNFSNIILGKSVQTINVRVFNNGYKTVIIENVRPITTLKSDSFYRDVTNDPSSVIIFKNVQDWVELQDIWNANNLSSTWDIITKKFSNQIPPRQLPPNLSNFSVPTKIYGELPFQITPPDSDSDGSFNYVSSNTDVATISGNIITIVNVGNTIITATQEATPLYLEGSITASFEVIDSTYINTPTPIYSGEGLSYMMTTTARYADIKNDIDYNENTKTILRSSTQKYISTLNGGNKKING
jgi:hypothetical protein